MVNFLESFCTLYIFLTHLRHVIEQIVRHLQLRGVRGFVERFRCQSIESIERHVELGDISAVLEGSALHLTDIIPRQIYMRQVQILKGQLLYLGDQVFGHVQNLKGKQTTVTPAPTPRCILPR